MLKCVVGVVSVCAGVAAADIESHETLAGFLNDPDLTLTPVLETFEGFGSGTTITDLPGSGIVDIIGTDRSGVGVDVNVTDEADLPFNLFTPGTLPSGTKFLSNDLANPFFGTGTIEVVFGTPSQAIGMFVADGSPLATFNITIFHGNGKLGSFNSAEAKMLPDSFFGVVSEVAITHAIFSSNDPLDSWGIDDLYTAVFPAPGTLGLLAFAGLATRRRRR